MDLDVFWQKIHDDIDAAVLRVLDPSKLDWWWNEPMQAFSGFTPQEMFDSKQWSTVLHYAESYSDPSYS